MNRRDLLKKSAVVSLAAGIPALVTMGACSSRTSVQAESHTTPNGSRAESSEERPSPLPVPSSGYLPAAFVISKDAEVLDFCGPLEVFAGAATNDGKPLFAPYMVSATTAPVIVGGNMKVVPDHTFKTAPQPKLIVIPAMDRDRAASEMYDWIRSASRSTDVTMSVCNGAFVLAKTGLLSGKSATAHHGGFFRFAVEFPDVHLRRGARFVEEGNLASAGGISSGIDLALRVVERYLGHAQVVQLADALEYQGKGWLNPNSNEAYAKLPAFTEETPICPVCLSTADRSIKSTHKGKTYYFCATSEKETFDKHADVFDRFLAEDQAQVGK